MFSGEDLRPKSEATFEEWKNEVNCIRQEGCHSEQCVAQAIRKPLREHAKCVLLPMGTAANIQDLLDRLDEVFGKCLGTWLLQNLDLKKRVVREEEHERKISSRI